MENNLIIFLSITLIFNLISMEKDNSRVKEITFDHLPKELKIYIFQYVAGRYNLNQIQRSINILSRINREFRSLTILDPDLYLIGKIKKDLIKCNYNCGLLFNSNKKRKEHELIHHKINVFLIIVMLIVMTYS